MIIIGAALLVIVLAFMLFDGTMLGKVYASVWSEQYIAQQKDEPSKMIAYALRASSSHNMQPWLVRRVDDNTLELYADMNKALPVVDGDNTQMLISQGTFMEAFREGAGRLGYVAEAEYAEPVFTDKNPLIAVLHIKKDAAVKEPDAVTSSTFIAENAGQGLDLKAIIDTCIAGYGGFQYTVVDSGSELEDLKEILLKGTVIESEDKAATLELLNIFRWTERDKNDYRYGLSLASLPDALKPFIQPVMKLSSGDWQSFGKSSIDQFRQRLAKEQSYILIKCKSPRPVDYVYAGQIYQKLISLAGGYEMRPAMQALEKYDAMKELNGEFQSKYGADGQVVLVIGAQPRTEKQAASNPRHLVSDIITG